MISLAHLIPRRSSRATSSPLSTSSGFLFFHKALTVIPITPKIMRNQLTHIFVISSPSGTSYRNLKYNPPKIRIAAKTAIKYLISICTQLTPSAQSCSFMGLLSDPMEALYHRFYDSRICVLSSKLLPWPRKRYCSSVIRTFNNSFYGFHSNCCILPCVSKIPCSMASLQ